MAAAEEVIVDEAPAAEVAPAELAADVDTAAVGPESAPASEGTELSADASEVTEADADQPELSGRQRRHRRSRDSGNDPRLRRRSGRGGRRGRRTRMGRSPHPKPPRTESGPTLASVRDQGGRFMHRMSRRMRRRMRGGMPETAPPPRTEPHRPEYHEEHRPEPEPRAETAVPKPAGRTETRPEKDRTPQTSITELLKEGQEIIVQIAKEPLGQKGARITSHIALPGRYVVYMPTLDHMGVSRKIASDEERLRLKKHPAEAPRRASPAASSSARPAKATPKTRSRRTCSSSTISGSISGRRRRSGSRAAAAPPRSRYRAAHSARPVERRLQGDLGGQRRSMYESVLRFVQRFQPALVGRVKMYTRPAPIFDAFSITNELEKALRPKVWLKSGGYIVINQTEALVAIDINTGKFVGKSNRLEDTIVKTNTEAVKEIVRQIRLRDLGGIIVIDFIDMDERKNRQKVMQALEEAMRADRAPYKILQFNDFGLVAITRKRVKQSLERTLCAPCPYCEGAGYVKSVQTVIGEILTEAQKIARAVEGPKSCCASIRTSRRC